MTALLAETVGNPAHERKNSVNVAAVE